MPFVAKATDSAIASIAARLMAGEPMENFPFRGEYPKGATPGSQPMADPMTLADPNMPWFSVKEAVLPFARFPASTRCWARKCAPPARSWAGTAPSPVPF